jgi:CBS domain containing-hemolysin-like protein
MEPLHPFPWFDAATILALIAINGVFAMSELAIVSARTAKLKAMRTTAGVARMRRFVLRAIRANSCRRCRSA